MDSIKDIIKRYESKLNPKWEKTYPTGLHKAGPGISMQIDNLDVIAKNLLHIDENIRRGVREYFADVAGDILEQAVKNAPIESGQLRERGEARVGGRLVAKGTNSEEGTVERFPLSSKTGWSVDRLDTSFVFHDLNRRKIYIDKNGNRHDRGSDTFMVSVAMHEGNYVAKKQGGPKYLERALQQFSSLIKPGIEKAVALALRMIG